MEEHALVNAMNDSQASSDGPDYKVPSESFVSPAFSDRYPPSFTGVTPDQETRLEEPSKPMEVINEREAEFELKELVEPERDYERKRRKELADPDAVLREKITRICDEREEGGQTVYLVELTKHGDFNATYEWVDLKVVNGTRAFEDYSKGSDDDDDDDAGDGEGDDDDAGDDDDDDDDDDAEEGGVEEPDEEDEES
eukprot:2312154-Prymnesium_polylepis.1